MTLDKDGAPNTATESPKPQVLFRWEGSRLTAVLGAAAVLLTFYTTRLIDNYGTNREITIRVAAVEARLMIVEAEQRKNSEARVRFEDAQVQYREAQAQWRIDIASVLDGQRIIMAELHEHERQENTVRVHLGIKPIPPKVIKLPAPPE